VFINCVDVFSHFLAMAMDIGGLAANGQAGVEHVLELIGKESLVAMALDRKALEPFLGSRSRVSEVLNRQRSLLMS